MNKNLWVVRQQFAQCVFNHKIYEVATERLEKYSLYINIVNIAIVSLALIFLVIQNYTKEQLYSNIASWITIAEILYLVIQQQFNFWDKIRANKTSALQYLWLRDEYKNFISDIICDKLSKNSIEIRRDSLQAKYQVINQLSQQTNRSDYVETQRRLNTHWENNEDYIWSDEEINQFLPVELR